MRRGRKWWRIRGATTVLACSRPFIRLQQEVHHQAPRVHAPASTEPQLAPQPVAALPMSALPENLDERLVAMERSLNRLIPLVRKVLYTVTAGQESE